MSRDEVIEAMGKAYFDFTCVNDGEVSLYHENTPSGAQARSFATARAEVMLDAALAAGCVLPGAMEHVGWHNATVGVHPIGGGDAGSTEGRPIHEYECYVTDVPVFILRGADE